MRNEIPILDLLGCLNEAVWLFVMMDQLFARRKYIREPRKFWLAAGLAGILWYALEAYLSWIPLLLLFTISLTLLWECELKKAASVVTGYVFAWAVVLWLAGYLPESTVLAAQAGWMLLNAVFMWWLRYRGGKERISALKPLRTLGLAFFSTVFFCDFLLDMIYGKNIRDYFFLASLMTALSAAYFYFHQMQLKERLYVLDAEYDRMEAQYAKTQDFYAENAKLYHDMKHHLRAIERFLLSGETQEALAYVEGVQEPLRCKTITVYTGWNIVDTVIHEAEETADRQGISLETVAAILPPDMRIEARELCALCANLLDNALEAAQKNVRLELGRTAGFLMIEISNDYLEKPQIRNNRFLPRKKDSLRHGWGMQIIEQIVDKYRGELEIRVDTVVTVRILLEV